MLVFSSMLVDPAGQTDMYRSHLGELLCLVAILSILGIRLQITDYKMAPKGAPVNGANLGSMGFKLSTKLINKLIIIR
jgi:hypothetical protein